MGQKFIWAAERPRIVRTILKKKNQAGGLTYPSFQVYDKVTLIQTVRHSCKITVIINVTENAPKALTGPITGV